MRSDSSHPTPLVARAGSHRRLHSETGVWSTPPRVPGDPQHSNAPPFDPEGDCLAFLTEFKRQYGSARRLTISEYLGNPEIRPVESIPIHEMMQELEFLLGELEAHSIRLDFPFAMTAREMYRSITEELFHMVIADVRITGMTHLFSYNDIHAPGNSLDQADGAGTGSSPSRGEACAVDRM